MNLDSSSYGKTGLDRVASLLSAPRSTSSGGGRRGSANQTPLTPSPLPPSLASSSSHGFTFSVHGNGLLQRRAVTTSGVRSGSRPSRNLHTRNGSSKGSAARPPSRGADRDHGRPPTAAYHVAAGTATGTLPCAAATAASLWMAGSSGGGGGGVSRPSSAAAANSGDSDVHAEPRFNNYVLGHSATAAAASRPPSSRAARFSRKPPRMPSAPPLTRVSSCGPAPVVQDVCRSTEAGQQHWPFAEEVGEGEVPTHKETPASPSQRSSTLFAPAPSRPLLRRLSPRRRSTSPLAMSGVSQGESTPPPQPGSHLSGTVSDGHSTSGPRSPVAVPSRRPQVPPIPMTRSSALRRPVLLTREASAAAAAAGASPTASSAANSLSRSTPRDAQTPRSPGTADPAKERQPPQHCGESAATLRGAAASSWSPLPSPTPPPPRTHANPSHRGRPSSATVSSSGALAGPHRHHYPQQQQGSAAHTGQGSTATAASAASSFILHAMPSFDGALPHASASSVGTAGHEAAAGHSAESSELPLSTTAPPIPRPRRGSLSITQLLRKDSRRAGPFSRPSSSNTRPSHATPPSPCGSPPGGAAHVVERLRERGNQYMLREEFARAIATYTEGIRLAPDNDVLWGNRASAFLLTFRYLPAVVDCLYVLHLRPGHAKAYWRAAKAYAAAYHFLEAKKYYLLAQQAALKEARRPSATTSTVSEDAHALSSSSTSSSGNGGCGGGAGVAMGEASATSGTAGAERAADSAESRSARQMKALRDYESILSEAQAVELVEQYWQHMHAEQWAAAVAVMDRILRLSSFTGPTAVSWQALRFEAMLPLNPKTVLAEAEALHRTYPGALEIFYVLAKALFYTVHDAASTQRCLQLLDEAAEQRMAQATLLNTHVRYAATQLRESGGGSGGDAAAAQLEAWVRRNQLKEDSRSAELRHSIDKFARHRDAGNRAYEKGNWEAAAAAYTQCMQTDCLNHSLLAAVHCNRTAVFMQAGRWREALSDADAAVRLSPQLATAYGRRGRIELYLLSQEYEAQRAILSRHVHPQWSAAAKEQLMRYADAAVADLTRAVELSPTAEHKGQLQQALAQRQTVKAVLSAATGAMPSAAAGQERQGSAAGASASSFRGASRPGSSASYGGGATYTRGFPHSRPSSSSSASGLPSSASPYSVTVQHLRLLGVPVTASAAAVGVLPDFKAVSKAYRECALRWHPDKWVSSTASEQQEAERQFKLIAVAYQELRERYGNTAAAA